VSIVSRLANQEAAAKANAPRRYVELIELDVAGKATDQHGAELAEILSHLGITAADARADRSALAEVRRLTNAPAPADDGVAALGEALDAIQNEQERHRQAMRELEAKRNEASLRHHGANLAAERVRNRIRELEARHPRVFPVAASAPEPERPVMTGQLPTPHDARPGAFGEAVKRMGFGTGTRQSIQTGGAGA
jgi:chromosome segregation ATPase